MQVGSSVPDVALDLVGEDGAVATKTKPTNTAVLCDVDGLVPNGISQLIQIAAVVLGTDQQRLTLTVCIKSTVGPSTMSIFRGSPGWL